MSQYIDDRPVGQLFRSPARASLVPSKVLAGIAKSQGVASTVIRFLGFLCDSSRQAFLLRSGNPLPHFTPWPTPGSAGVNVFANSLPARQNVYIFPPFVLIGPLLRYIFSQDFHDAFTLVVPGFHTRPYWWAPLQALIVDRLLLGRKGSSSVLLFPSQHSPQWLPRDLQWDLWAFRCVCQ